jgi:hypothetical protein
VSIDELEAFISININTRGLLLLIFVVDVLLFIIGIRPSKNLILVFDLRNVNLNMLWLFVTHPISLHVQSSTHLTSDELTWTQLLSILGILGIHTIIVEEE